MRPPLLFIILSFKLVITHQVIAYNKYHIE